MSIPAQAFARRLTFDCITSSCPEFDQVLDLRGVAYEQEFARKQEHVDSYSDHYVCRLDGELVGALRTTHKTAGELESESAYPRWILDNFSTQLSGTSRLCVKPNLKGANKVSLPLIRYAWSVAIGKGIRLDVSKVRLDAIPYYLRLGYYFVTNSFFDFDRSDSICAFVACPANADRKTPISDLFEDLADPLSLETTKYGNRLSKDYRSFRRQSRDFLEQRMKQNDSTTAPKGEMK